MDPDSLFGVVTRGADNHFVRCGPRPRQVSMKIQTKSSQPCWARNCVIRDLTHQLRSESIANFNTQRYLHLISHILHCFSHCEHDHAPILFFEYQTRPLCSLSIVIMGSIEKTNGTNGHTALYSVPTEAAHTFQTGILQNELISKSLPPEVHETARNISFTGTYRPRIPINWRFAESAASLKALEASVIGALLKRKFGLPAPRVVIDTDHASLFLMSTLLYTIDPTGPSPITASFDQSKLTKYIKNCDLHHMSSSSHRTSATNIYQTKDGKWFHLHGSMNPDPTLDSVGLPHEMDAASPEESWKPFQDKLSQIDSAEMQRLASDVYKQAGVICNSHSSFLESEHGKANAHVGLFEIHPSPNENQHAYWWPDSPQTSAKRPLAGLKVVDLTRVIAAPAVTRGLAELGASVMRITSEKVTDFSSLHVDLSWGKWNGDLDLKSPEGQKALKALILEADVVVQGYRPGVLDKYGFGQQGIIDLCKDRNRGIISARENCYGWHGPWQGRSGWQQISDACVGISEGFGKAMGLQDGEAVTPVFPNSDYMTGIAGVVGILCALMKRAETGGSYKVDLALNYYNQWLARSVGTYPEEVWEELWTRNGKVQFRAENNMGYTIPRVMEMIKGNSGKALFNPKFFEQRESSALGVNIQTVKPIIRFENDEVELRYNVGTRGNGVDKPRWPEDLMTEIVR